MKKLILSLAVCMLANFVCVSFAQDNKKSEDQKPQMQRAWNSLSKDQKKPIEMAVKEAEPALLKKAFMNENISVDELLQQEKAKDLFTKSLQLQVLNDLKEPQLPTVYTKGSIKKEKKKGEFSIKDLTITLLPKPTEKEAKLEKKLRPVMPGPQLPSPTLVKFSVPIRGAQNLEIRKR